MFPNYKYNFIYPTQKELTKSVLSQAIIQSGYSHLITKTNHDNYDEYKIISKSDSYFYRNSYYPTIIIKVQEVDKCYLLNISYTLHKHIKLIIIIMLTASIFIEGLFAFFCLTKQIHFNIVLLIPLLIAIAQITLSFVIIGFYAKKINKKLINRLSLNPLNQETTL